MASHRERARAQGLGLVVCGAVAVSLVCLAAAATDAAAVDAGDARSGKDGRGAGYVKCEGNLLTARTYGMSLRDVLLEVGRQSGATMRLEGLTDKPTSDSFSKLPVDEALRRLMPEQNFTVVYSNERGPGGNVVGTRIKEVRVWPGSGLDPAARTTPQSPPSPRPAREKRRSVDKTAKRPAAALSARWSRFFKRHASVPLAPDSALAAALDGERASLQRIVASGVRDEDEDVRRQAAAAFAEVLDGDPRSVALVASGAEGESDIDSLASGLRAAGSPYTEEFLESLGRRLTMPVLRLKANQILGRYRRGG